MKMASLSVLEAIFIKTLNSILCRQKEFVYNLTLLSHKSPTLNSALFIQHCKYLHIQLLSFILMFSPDECPKSFETMNTLLLAIFQY